MANRVVPIVASGLERAFARTLLNAVPDIEVAVCSEETPWEIPVGTQMVVVEPRGCWNSAPKTMPEAWASVRCVQSVSAGMDGFPSWLCDIPVIACARGLTAAPIAEYALCAMLCHAKAFNRNRLSGPSDWTSEGISGLRGATLGIAGYGAIGQEIARLAQTFGMSIVINRRRPRAKADGVVAVSSLPELAACADHLIIALPLTSETRKIIDAKVLSSAKPGCHVVNLSRGGVLDLEALRSAMGAGHVAFATLDVTEPEPLPDGHWAYSHPHIHLTPHMSWRGDTTTFASRDKMVIDNVKRFATGEPLENLFLASRGY